MIRVCAVIVCATAATFVAGASARTQSGCTDSWAAASSGSWGTASAWSAGRVPTTTDNVCITLPGTYTVTIAPIGSAAGQSVASLTLGATSGTQTLDVSGESSISTSNETQNTTALVLMNGGTISSSGMVILDATGGGTPTQGGALGGNAVLISYKTLANDGRIQTQVEDKAWQAYFSGTLLNERSGSLSVASGTLTMPSPSTSGYGGANTFAVTNDGTLAVSTGASFAMEAGIGASGSFANAGTIKNSGSLVAAAQAGPMMWTEAGSEQGQPVIFETGASLADVSGAGEFLFADASGSLTGTIPASQTVIVRGEPYSYQGEEYYSTTLTLNNAQNKAPAVVNRGTVIVDSPGSGPKSGGDASLAGGNLLNYGRIVASVEDASWTNGLKVGLVNEAGGTVAVKSGILEQDATTPTTNHGLVTVAPGATWALSEGASFANAHDGTLALQIASKTRLGVFQLSAPCCQGAGKLTAGGALHPTLVGGFKPSASSAFDLFELQGGQFAGTFANVAGGFSGDYSHETATPAYAGVTYGAGVGKKKG
jgi:hypothetical protein